MKPKKRPWLLGDTGWEVEWCSELPISELETVFLDEINPSGFHAYWDKARGWYA